MAFASRLIGGARKAATQRGLTPQEQAMLQGMQPELQPVMEQFRPAPSPPMGMPSARPLIGGSMPQPKPQQPAKRPSMWDGIAQDPLAFLLRGSDGVAERQAAEAKQAQYEAEQQRMEQMAQAAGLDPGAMLAMYANPEEFGKSYSTNYEAANVPEGGVRYFGNKKQPFAGPPKASEDIRQVGNNIVQRQPDGQWKPVYTATSPAEAARAFSMFIDKKTGRQMFLMSDGQTRDTGVEAYIPTQITSVGGVPTAVDKRTLQTSALTPLEEAAGNKAAMASAEVQGKAQGQAAFDLPTVEMRSQAAIASIGDLRKRDISQRYGMQGKLYAIPGTDGADVQALVNQVTSQAFLNAFDQLRGAGAITEREGQAATQAITRLQNQNITIGEAMKAMDELERYYRKGLEVARQKATRGPTLPDRPAASAQSGPIDVSDLLEKYK